MLLALLLATTQGSTRTVNLSLGAMISDGAGGQYRYEAVEDTYLDRSIPEKNSGGEFLLQGGRDKTILIRFGDLERALGEYTHIKKAVLHLGAASSTPPQLLVASRVLVPWNEGPMIVATKRSAVPPATAPGATWKERHAGGSWASPGARGDTDAKPITEAKQTVLDAEIEIGGLESAVQAMEDEPALNYGLSLSFGTDCSFVSSQDKENRPRLELEVEKPASAASGPDLSVVRIDRTPTYDAAGPKMTPAKGEQVTYTAHIANIGLARSPGFVAHWIVDGKSPSAIEIAKPLDPGQETTVTFTQAYEPSPTDHRLGRIVFAIAPTGGEANPRNNSAEVCPGARILGLTVEASFAKAIEQRYGSLSDWAQTEMRVLNDVYLAHSRFSFASDGVLERFRLQSIAVVPDGKLADQRQGEDLDAVVTFSSGDAGLSSTALDREFVHRLGQAIGLTELGAMNVAYQPANGKVAKANSDPYGGIMGGGDTRYDGGLPGFIALPYEPSANPIFQTIVAEPTDLFSATNAAALNSSLATRGKVKPPLVDQPTLVLLKAVNLDGTALPGAELTFFQTKGGKIDDGAPVFTLTTDAGGTATLPNRGGEPKPTAFGTLDPTGNNGLFLVRATSNGVTDYDWLKAWQLADAFHRTGSPAPEFQLRLNLPTEPLDMPTNLAEGRSLTDSANSPEAKLAPLTDGKEDEEVALPPGKGGWVEIDLGRDRFVGEVQLVFKSAAFWPKFDILGYATGQDAAIVEPWSREIDWDWTKGARGEKTAAGNLLIHYRATASRFRYLRIVNRGSEGGAASLAEIRVIPVKTS